jgi:hypothetical protein
MGTGSSAPVTPPRNFASESTKRTTPKKRNQLPMPPSIPPTLTARERKRYIQEYRKEHTQLVANIAELSAIDGGALSRSDKLQASQLAVDLGFTTHELRRSWIIFERLASTMPDRVTVREMVLYFHVRRTILVDLLFHCFADEQADQKEKKALAVKQNTDDEESEDDASSADLSTTTASTTGTQLHKPPPRLNLSFPNFIKTFCCFATCDHSELVDRMCIVIAGVRGGRTLLDVAEAIHGSPLPEDPSILLNVLGRLHSVETDDVCSYSQELKMPVVDKKKLLAINRDFPTLLYPMFKVTSLLKEKFLGLGFWARMREKTTSLGLRGFWGPTELRKGILKDRRKRLLVRCQIEIRADKARAQALGRNPITALAQQVSEKGTNARTAKDCSVVDMSMSNSSELAWRISAHNMCKIVAIEGALEEFYEREEESFALGKKANLRLPGDDLMWLEMCDGIYRPEVWQFIAELGFQVSSRVRTTVTAGAAPKVDKHGTMVLSAKELEGAKEESTSELVKRLQAAEVSWDQYWRIHKDARTKRKFYYNLRTGERTWKKPLAFKRLREAERKRKGKKKERPRQTEAHGWDAQGGAWKPRTIAAQTDRKRRKRAMRRRQKKQEAEAEEEDVVDARLANGPESISAGVVVDNTVTGAGGDDENIQLYRGNQVMVIMNADRYRVQMVPALIEYADDGNLTYGVLFDDGTRESSVVRTRLVVTNMAETIDGLDESTSEEESTDEEVASVDTGERFDSSSGEDSSETSDYSDSSDSDSS